ncbi:MAG: response regulator [Acidisphaera sp.]|nr:response regulator [Acidisphaera sp.]
MTRTRILVVEDEPLIREMMAETLDDAGYDVLQAESGERASRLMQEPDSIDLLLTDVQMPGSLDGVAVAEQAHAHDPDLPVLFVTGGSDVLAQRRLTGQEHVLCKPFVPTRLVETVRQLTETVDDGADAKNT